MQEVLRQAAQQCLGEGTAAVAAEYQQFAATCLDLLLQAAQDATLQHFMAQSRATRWQFLCFVVQ
ncbi:hypothetical protein GY12_08950 [Micrococcus luteus]|nr:hypothetical protein GY12_08950 [Micrococcus luteus]